jgi:hypothetical protein
MVRRVRSIVGGALLRVATELLELGDLILPDDVPLHPDDDDSPVLRQDPITPEAASMLEPMTTPAARPPSMVPLAGSIEARIAKARTF